MSVYLDEDFCKKIIEKSMTTSITKLNKIESVTGGKSSVKKKVEYNSSDEEADF